jgi:predicted nuclease of predicted toxin-antitoxin system
VKSKRQSNTSSELPNPVFFLDRTFGEKMCDILQAAEFAMETHRVLYYGRQNVTDPEIINECGKRSLFILTADNKFPIRWEIEIRRAQVGVFVLSNNHERPEIWGPRVVSLKTKIIHAAQHRPRPFIGHISTGAELTLKLLKPRN